MVALLFEWTGWSGVATGSVILSSVEWDRTGGTFQVPWSKRYPVNGATVIDVTASAGRPMQITWAPAGGAVRDDYVLIPAGDNPDREDGAWLAHRLAPLDPRTLRPVSESQRVTVIELLRQIRDEADDAAALSREAALSVMPMLSGSVTITPNGGTLAVDLGQAVNVVTGLAGTSGAVDVTFPAVTTPDGRVNPDGLGTLLRVDADAERLTWPGGTVVHGRPPTNAEAFASLVRVAGVVHVIWSVVDATPPPIADSGTGAVQATLEDVLGGRVRLMPGGTVVSSVPTFGQAQWRFANLADEPGTNLTLTDGVVAAYYHGASYGQYLISQGPCEARLVRLSLSTGNMDLQPEEGSGWLIASIPQDASWEAREYFGPLAQAIPEAIYTYENPRDWSGPQIIVMPYRPDAPGWTDPSDGYVSYMATRPMDPFGETTTMRLIRPLSPDEIDAMGISFPLRYMTPAEMAPYLDGGA